MACTGVHGANRLASNSLLEGLVFGARAGCAMREEHTSGMDRVSDAGSRASTGSAPLGGFDGRIPDPGPADGAKLSTILWQDVGLFRDRDGLTRALDAFEPAWRALDQRLRGGGTLAADEWRTASIVTVGRLIARAALRREESRGGHDRSDYPDRDDIHWKRRVSETRD